jgi:hypothetical protein
MFVGDERVTESTIDGYVSTIADLRTEQGEDLSIHDYSGDRNQVVVYVLYTELGEAVGLESASGGEPADLEAISLQAEANFQELVSMSEPRELTDAEIEALNAAAAGDPNVAGYTEADLMLLAGFTDDLAGYVEEYDIAVNPRYGEFDLSPLPSVFPVEVPQR